MMPRCQAPTDCPPKMVPPARGLCWTTNGNEDTPPRGPVALVTISPQRGRRSDRATRAANLDHLRLRDDKSTEVCPASWKISGLLAVAALAHVQEVLPFACGVLPDR